MPPQRAPGGSGQLGTPRVRPSRWAPRHRLGGPSELPPKGGRHTKNATAFGYPGARHTRLAGRQAEVLRAEAARDPHQGARARAALGARAGPAHRAEHVDMRSCGELWRTEAKKKLKRGRKEAARRLRNCPPCTRAPGVRGNGSLVGEGVWTSEHISASRD